MQLKKSIIISIVLGAVCAALLTPIRDNDLFWHLATGKWIVEHKTLPEADPFAYTTSLKAQEEFVRAKIILTQYWLANLLQYGIFSFSGFNGIIILRVLIVLLTLLVIFAHLRSRGLRTLPNLLLLLPISFVLIHYKGDRPNQMTFLFLALFLFLLDALKKGEKKGYLLPIVYILWANMHGGFILGGAIAGLVFATELFRPVFFRTYLLNKKLLLFMGLICMAGFLNPNGYNVIYSMLFETSQTQTASIGESKGPFFFISTGNYLYVWIQSISFFLALSYLLSRLYLQFTKKRDSILLALDEIFILLFLSVLSFTSIRYIPLFVIALVPMVSPLFSGRFQALVLRLSRYFVPELLIVAASIWTISTAYNDTLVKNAAISSYYPDDAVQFIKEKEIKGHFFNYYDWGGYFIWQFYPDKFVFIDGRAVSLKTADAAQAVISNADEKIMDKPLYAAILDSYSVRHIIIPPINYLGDINYVLQPLVDDPDWRLIFVGRNSLIFTRDPIEPTYPKSLSYALALSNARRVIISYPNNPLPYLTYAKANYQLGGASNAIKGLEEALEKRPALRGTSVEKALKLLQDGKEIPLKMH